MLACERRPGECKLAKWDPGLWRRGFSGKKLRVLCGAHDVDTDVGRVLCITVDAKPFTFPSQRTVHRMIHVKQTEYVCSEHTFYETYGHSLPLWISFHYNFDGNQYVRGL